MAKYKYRYSVSFVNGTTIIFLGDYDVVKDGMINVIRSDDEEKDL